MGAIPGLLLLLGLHTTDCGLCGSPVPTRLLGVFSGTYPLPALREYISLAYLFPACVHRNIILDYGNICYSPPSISQRSTHMSLSTFCTLVPPLCLRWRGRISTYNICRAFCMICPDTFHSLMDGIVQFCARSHWALFSITRPLTRSRAGNAWSLRSASLTLPSRSAISELAPGIPRRTDIYRYVSQHFASKKLFF